MYLRVIRNVRLLEFLERAKSRSYFLYYFHLTPNWVKYLWRNIDYYYIRKIRLGLKEITTLFNTLNLLAGLKESC
jgi:hypothetical protein